MTVTVVSGFLGSGKTTLLRRLLRENHGKKLGVIVNDLAGLEVDSDLLRGTHRVSEQQDTLISLSDGSISGDQRHVFAEALNRWSEGSHDHVLVETSGSTHPWPLVQEISSRPACRLTSFVTLVDARAFVEDYGAGPALFRQLIDNEERQVRTAANLMAEQIQFANLIFITKTDRISSHDLPLLMKCLEILNPTAEIIPVTFGRVPAEKLLIHQNYNLAHARELARHWLEHPFDNPGDASAYDLVSTVICDPRPFHPLRLWQLCQQGLRTGIHRSKGFIWLASRDEQVLLWNQAAGGIDLELLAYWRSAVAKDPLGILLPEEKAVLRAKLHETHPQFGDRLNELTIIGTLADRGPFVQALEGCFCTEAEIRRWEQGGSFPDPWPTSLKQVT